MVVLPATIAIKHPSVQLESEAEGRRIVHHAGTRKYFRLGIREAQFLESLDGRRGVDELRQCNVAGFGAAEVDALLAWFGSHQLLAGDEPVAGERSLVRRVVDFATGPDRWRIHLVDPDAFLDRHRAAIDRLFTPAALAVYLLILLAPLAVPLGTADLLRLAPERFSAGQWLAMYAATLVVIALHELAHAVTCKHFGGQVHRIGLMLLYLQPVVYCDVSDSWRLRSRDAKIAIALAGCFFQLLLSCLLVVAWGMLRIDLLLLFALVNAGIAALNLIPFVKLDGYWVAVHLMDEPRLRERGFRALMRLAMHGSVPVGQCALLAFGLGSALATLLFWTLGLQALHGLVARLSPAWADALLAAAAAVALVRLAHWGREQWLAVRGGQS